MKWQQPRSRTLNVYHLGDTLEDLEDEYNNTWIRTDYICNACSRHVKGRYGPDIRTEDQQHPAQTIVTVDVLLRQEPLDKKQIV